MKDQNEAALDLLFTLHSSRVPGSQAASYTGHRDFVITNMESHHNPQRQNAMSSRQVAPGLRAMDRGQRQRPGNKQSRIDRELAMALLLQERWSPPRFTEEETAPSPRSS